MAADTHSNYAFDAFQTQLKTLCLNEFPCGPGKWRETVPSTAPKNVKSNSKVESQFSITLKDFGANHEKTETLQEYVGSAKSPWSLDYSWSQEAKPLRELAVKSPWLIDDNFVLSYFKTLRIVNKNVTEIDENLMRFKNLEELTLSCNLISRINSNNLPDNLKVLEVCANQVSDLSALCEKPPGLIHLGLGYNKLNVLGDYLTAQYWPQLLSLDLSNNNLSDILDVVQKLSTLPKMRNLVLQGNPLSLIPGYRGYTVDCLRKLSVLDDIMISADERHYFKGLARRREHILDEAKVKLTVTYIKGLPMPEELKNPEEQPEFPVIERKYFVQFMFLEDSTLRTFADHVGHDDSQEMAELSGLKSERTEHSDIGDTELSGVEQVEKSVVFTEAPDILHTIDHRAQVAPSVLSDIEEKKKEEEEDKAGEPKKIKVSPVDSAKLSWAEELECNWTKAVVRDDLLALRDFFKQGMQIAVMEEVTLSYPIIQEETEDGSVPNTKVEGYPFDASTPVQGVAKGTKKDKKEKKDEKRKSSGKEKGDDKKKKKEPQQEMKRNPPTYTTLATWHVPLAEFLEGEYSYQGVFSKGNIEIASTVKTMDIDQGRKPSAMGEMKNRTKSAKQEPKNSATNKTKATSTSSRRTSWAGLADLDAKKGDAKDKNKKPTSAGKKKEDPKDKSKERKGSAAKGGKADAKGDKSGKGAKGGVAAPDDEEDPGPPPPLEIHIQVDLHHWKTAMDLLKDEEERNKPPTEEQKEM